jgi:hypothetical protein
VNSIDKSYRLKMTLLKDSPTQFLPEGLALRGKWTTPRARASAFPSCFRDFRVESSGNSFPFALPFAPGDSLRRPSFRRIAGFMAVV